MFIANSMRMNRIYSALIRI